MNYDDLVLLLTAITEKKRDEAESIARKHIQHGWDYMEKRDQGFRVRLMLILCFVFQYQDEKDFFG